MCFSVQGHYLFKLYLPCRFSFQKKSVEKKSEIMLKNFKSARAFMIIKIPRNTYMLFAGGRTILGKTVSEGHAHSLSQYRPTCRSTENMFIFSCGKLVYKRILCFWFINVFCVFTRRQQTVRNFATSIWLSDTKH